MFCFVESFSLQAALEFKSIFLPSARIKGESHQVLLSSLDFDAYRQVQVNAFYKVFVFVFVILFSFV